MHIAKKLIMDFNSLVAFRIKKIRTEKNLTQKYVAEALGITENAYSRIENGHTQINITYLNIIAQRIDSSIIELLNLPDNNTINNNNNLVMNNVNHGNLNINLTHEEFEHVFKSLQELKNNEQNK